MNSSKSTHMLNEDYVINSKDTHSRNEDYVINSKDTHALNEDYTSNSESVLILKETYELLDEIKTLKKQLVYETQQPKHWEELAMIFHDALWNELQHNYCHTKA